MNKFIIIFAVVIARSISYIWACTCAPMSWQQEVNLMQVIIKGKIIAVLPDSNFSMLVDSARGFYQKWVLRPFKVQVLKVYKGEICEKEIVVFSAIGGAACGTYLYPNSTYLIFANIFPKSNFPTKIETSMCSRTKTFNKQDEDSVKFYLNLKDEESPCDKRLEFLNTYVQKEIVTLKATPNPFSDNLTINLLSNITTVISFQYEILDMTGKVAVKGFYTQTGDNALELDTSKLINGIYLVKVSLGSQILTQKVVLER